MAIYLAPPFAEGTPPYAEYFFVDYSVLHSLLTETITQEEMKVRFEAIFSGTEGKYFCLGPE
jgi:hypothetical protein